jgi:hypothetical protein
MTAYETAARKGDRLTTAIIGVGNILLDLDEARAAVAAAEVTP